MDSFPLTPPAAVEYNNNCGGLPPATPFPSPGQDEDRRTTTSTSPRLLARNRWQTQLRSWPYFPQCSLYCVWVQCGLVEGETSDCRDCHGGSPPPSVAQHLSSPHLSMHPPCLSPPLPRTVLCQWERSQPEVTAGSRGQGATSTAAVRSGLRSCSRRACAQPPLWGLSRTSHRSCLLATKCDSLPLLEDLAGLENFLVSLG